MARPLTLDEFLKKVYKNEKTDISKARILNFKGNVQTTGGPLGG
jgi:hypothetical protein